MVESGQKRVQSFGSWAEAVSHMGFVREKTGWSWENKPAFPALARLIRRKWLISRVCAG